MYWNFGPAGPPRLAICCLGAACLLGGFVSASQAEQCHGTPGALGTARVMALDPASVSPKSARCSTRRRCRYVITKSSLRSMTVLTRPQPLQLLDALAAQCKFRRISFWLASMCARGAGTGPSCEYEEGHTVGKRIPKHTPIWERCRWPTPEKRNPRWRSKPRMLHSASPTKLLHSFPRAISVDQSGPRAIFDEDRHHALEH